MKRNGKKIKREDQNGVMINGKADRRGSWSYMKRDGSCQQIALPRSVSTDAGLSNSADKTNKVSINGVLKPIFNINCNLKPMKSSHSSLNGFSTKSRNFKENDAFNGIADIGDDDL